MVLLKQFFLYFFVDFQDLLQCLPIPLQIILSDKVLRIQVLYEILLNQCRLLRHIRVLLIFLLHVLLVLFQKFLDLFIPQEVVRQFVSFLEVFLEIGFLIFLREVQLIFIKLVRRFNHLIHSLFLLLKPFVYFPHKIYIRLVNCCILLNWYLF